MKLGLVFIENSSESGQNCCSKNFQSKNEERKSSPTSFLNFKSPEY
jgi:hypothetical protein